VRVVTTREFLRRRNETFFRLSPNQLQELLGEYEGEAYEEVQGWCMTAAVVVVVVAAAAAAAAVVVVVVVVVVAVVKSKLSLESIAMIIIPKSCPSTRVSLGRYQDSF